MPVTRTETVYTLYGDVFAISLLAASALLTIGVSLRRLAWRLRVTHQAPSPLEKLL
jgi:hypothetical protein